MKRRFFKNESKKNTSQYRQGDILLLRVDSIPEDAEVIREEDKIIIAYGETTGHAHILESPGAKLFQIDRAEIDEHYLALTEEGKMVHDEHTTHTYPPGKYKVYRQYEHEPTGIRQVMD